MSGLLPFIDQVEILSCDAALARKNHLRCSDCPDLAELQTFTKRHRSNDGCINDLKLEYACQRSPWKNFTIQERYAEVMHLMKSVSTKLPKKLFACIAAKETLFLDPVSITCSDLSGKTTQSGLGHIMKPTFYDIFGYDKDILARTRKDERDTEIQRIWARIRSADWLRPYNCKIRNGVSVEKFLDSIFEDAYQRDPLLQLAAMAKVLQGKPGLTLSRKVLNYNGSSTKVRYSREVMSCLRCLESGGAPVRCLDIASQEEYGNGKICK